MALAAITPFLPYIAAALGVPTAISGVMGIVNEAKKMKGGRVRRLLLRHKAGRGHKRKGRGVLADIAGSLPLLGSMLGPIVKSFGGKVRRRKAMRRRKGGKVRHTLTYRHIKGRGLVPMRIYSPMAVGSGIRRHRKRRVVYRHVRGRGLVPMRIYSPMAVGAGLRRRKVIHRRKGRGLMAPTKMAIVIKRRGGLLSPTGVGGKIYRKGHYRYVGGKRVRVAPALVKRGGKVRHCRRRRHGGLLYAGRRY